MVATFNGNPSATIICYSPTNISEEIDLIAFYNELSSLVHNMGKKKKKKKKNTHTHTLSSLVETWMPKLVKTEHKFSLHKQHLTDFTLEKINMPQY